MPCTATVIVRAVPSALVIVKVSSRFWPSRSACTSALALSSVYVHRPPASIENVPSAPPIVAGANTDSPLSGSVIVSCPTATVVPSSVTLPVSGPSISGSSLAPMTWIVSSAVALSPAPSPTV